MLLLYFLPVVIDDSSKLTCEEVGLLSVRKLVPVLNFKTYTKHIYLVSLLRDR